jgi:hypothetical protein
MDKQPDKNEKNYKIFYFASIISDEYSKNDTTSTKKVMKNVTVL